MTSVIVFNVFLLAVGSAIGLRVAYNLSKSKGKSRIIQAVFLLNYVFVYLISGIAHLLRPQNSNHGYFNLLNGPSVDIFVSTFMSILGLAGALFGVFLLKDRNHSLHLKEQQRYFWLGDSERKVAIFFISLIIPISFYSFSQLWTYLSSLDLERITAVDGGVARYAFMSQWCVWAVSLLALLIIADKKPRSEFVTLGVLAVALIAIAASLRWTGGRSIIILMVFPLIVTVLPRLRRSRWLALMVGGVGLLLYLAMLTKIRSASYSQGTGLNFVSWIDWEWGRYSMVGFASSYVRDGGLLYGETFVDGLVGTVVGVIQLFGFDLTYDAITPSAIASKYLVNSNFAYIVPGFTAEAYMNFGAFGVFASYLALGICAAWLDRRLTKAHGALKRFGISFVGSVLIFRAIPTDSISIYSYILYSGLPVILFWGASSILYARRQPKHLRLSQTSQQAENKRSSAISSTLRNRIARQQ